jgi:membrane-associated phospholipid phosphatase
MLVDARRGLRVSGFLLGGAVVIGVLVALPATLPAVQAVDDAVWRWAGGVENGPATAVAVGMSWLGSAWVNWPLRILAILLLAWRRHWSRLLAFALAVVTSEVAIGSLKAAYDRPRPPGALIATSAASFPSGHAIAGAVTAVGLVLVLAPPGRARLRWEVWAVVFATVMALSRVYLRAHWLSDSVAGALLGAGLALGWPALVLALRERGGGLEGRDPDARTERSPTPVRARRRPG